MNSKEALKELFELAVFDDNCNLNECKKCSVKLKHNCPYRYYKIVEQDLEVLEAIEKSITFEPPKDFKNSLYFNNYIVVYNKIPITKELQEKLTQWIIDNIDKEKVRKWLKDNELKTLAIFKKYLDFEISKDPISDGRYIVKIKDVITDDYMYIFVSEEEKDLLKKWLEYGDNIY